MKRAEYYNYIDRQLHILANRITTNGKLNMLHLHLHSENFYLHLFNLLYDKNLKNLNDISQNVEAIDLIDHDNKIMIQVSSTSTKPKIESALSKEKLKEHQDYRFKFISIAKDATNLRDKTYKNPYSIKFDTLEDIYDIRSFLNTILSLDIDKFKAVHEFILKELGEESMNGDINNQKTVHAKTNVENINNHGVINIYNSEGKKLITKEEIEAQRAKEEKLIFSSTPKSNQPYINRDVDALLSNRIAQKKGCVIFLHGQGGIGKSTLLEKFSQSDRPTIFIHINERIEMSVVDIFFDEGKTTAHNCPKFEEVLDEIFIVKENEEKIPFDAELKLLNAIKEDFGEHGVFVVDTLEKNKESHIISRVKFDGDRVRFVRTPTKQRFRDYLEKLIYLFVSHTTFIIAGRNSLNELNMELPLNYVEELELENFSISHIRELFSLAIKQDSKLSMPTEKHLIYISELTNGNPLLVELFPKIAREYNNEWDYAEMERRVKTDRKNGLLFYMTDRVLSHLDNSKDVWKLVIPRVLTEETERLLFDNSQMLEKLIDVGLARKGLRKDSERYYLHDDVNRAMVAYYEREFKNGFSSWHDHQEVANVHRALMAFYENFDELHGVNSAFEGCYHKIMLRERFERTFELTREEFATSILGHVLLRDDKKIQYCQEFNIFLDEDISFLIKQFKVDKKHSLSYMSQELYNAMRDNNKGIYNVDFLLSLSKKKEFKKDSSVYFYLGFAYEAINKYDEAIESFLKALEKNFKKEDEVYYNIGIAYYKKEEYDKAIEFYEETIKINPKHDWAYNNIGIAYYEKEEYDKAIEAYKKAIKINPQEDEAYNNMGSAYYKKEEYDKAIETYQKAVEINPKYDLAYYTMGIAYADKGEYDKAIEAYQKAVNINPQRDDAYHNMGIIYSNKKEYDKAIESYKKAVNINPQRDEAYYNMGGVYYWLKEFDEAIKSYIQAININPNDSSDYINLFELQLTKKQPFDQLLEKKYIELFQNQKESFIKYEMLKILQNIVQNQEVDIEGWVQKYRGVGLDDWSFDELREWIDGVEEGEIKERLIEAVGVFEGHG